jgi:hypothetical protein
MRAEHSFVASVLLACLIIASKFCKEPEECVVNRCWAEVWASASAHTALKYSSLLY